MIIDAILAINWVAVVIGTIGYQVLGGIWYGPVFGSRWVAAMGFENASDLHDGKTPTMGYLMTTFGSLIAVISLGILLELVEASTWVDGLLVGLLVGIGFITTTGLQAVPFEDRPWSVYLLNIGYNILGLAGVSVLLILL